MERLQSQQFGTVNCDFYQSDGEIWLTREQIGRALEYTDPMVAIGKMHDRHKDRLDKYSFTTLVNGHRSYLYNVKGIYEVCRWSQQPKADAFMDWAWDTIEKLRKGQAAPQMDTVEIIQATAAAVVGEIVKQLVPILRDMVHPTPATTPTQTVIHNSVWAADTAKQHCKMETFPETLRQNVDAMLEEMVAEQNLNFSRIARYCVSKGYMISSPSVKTYFRRRGLAEGI
ncbi:MAG: BRO family protein [Ethanoligenens sp.]